MVKKIHEDILEIGQVYQSSGILCIDIMSIQHGTNGKGLKKRANVYIKKY